MHTREEYVKICQTCSKRASSMQKGLVCSLTQEHAAFETPKCPDYEIDEKAAARRKRMAEQQIEDELEASTGGLSKFGIKNSIVSGIIILAIGLAWIIIGYSMGRIFYYPIVLIIAGIAVSAKGVIDKSEKEKREKTQEEKLDDII